jgi:hypothetical protein
MTLQESCLHAGDETPARSSFANRFLDSINEDLSPGLVWHPPGGVSAIEPGDYVGIAS